MNQLQNIDEFKRVLADYTISDKAKAALQQVRLALFVGPSSSGRNTIINELLQTGQYHYIVSDTTRQKRENNGVMEQDGREYWFRTENDLLDDLKHGEFLEAAIIHNQQVSGISIRELRQAASESKIAVNEIEVVGADHIHSAKPDAVFIFVVPPSFDEWMVRMSVRGTLPADEVRRRVESAVSEIETALSRDYYWFMVNDTFKQTTERVKTLIETGSLEPDEQNRGRETARKLLEATRTYLED